MNRIETFQSPTMIADEPESPAAAAPSPMEQPAANEDVDTFERAPSASSSPWSSAQQTVGNALGELRNRLGPATSALDLFTTVRERDGAPRLDGALGAIDQLAGPLSKLAGALGWAEGAAKIPEATRELDEAFDAYQRAPSKENGERFQAAFEGWREAVQPLVDKLPLSPVASQLEGMLEIASKTCGGMSVVLAERNEKAVAAAEGRAATPAEQEPTDPTLAASNAKIADDTGRDAAVPSFEDIPVELDRKLEAWRSGNGLGALPPRVQSSRARVLDLHERLAAIRTERSSSWSPARRAELETQAKKLALELRSALGQLEIDSSAAAPSRTRDLLLGNVKSAF